MAIIINHQSFDYLIILSFAFILFDDFCCLKISSIKSSPQSINANVQQQKRGPEFLIEPPGIITFMNDTGTVITCSARGQPSPKIYWIYATIATENGIGGGGMMNHLIPVDGLQQIRHDSLASQLIYLPFKSNQYRQDVHSIRIRCIATNQFGSIQSHDIQIRACK